MSVDESCLNVGDDIKKCPKCDCEKPIIEFSKNKARKDGLCYMCKICNSNYHRGFYKNNPTKSNANSRAWDKANPEKRLNIKRAWQKANPDKVKASKKQTYNKNIDNYRIYEHNYRNNNRDKVNAANKAWRKNNKAKVLASVKAWQKANPDKCRIIESRRRAKKVNQLHPNHDVEIERQLLNNARGLEVAHGIKHHVDHIWPLSKGGPHHHDNLQVISQVLNNQKKDSLIFQHSSVKNWTDLPSHVIDWIYINQPAAFNMAVQEIIKSCKFSIDVIESFMPDVSVLNGK